MRTLTSQELERLLEEKGDLSKVVGVKKISPNEISVGSTVLKLEIDPSNVHVKKIRVKEKYIDDKTTIITGRCEYRHYTRSEKGEFYSNPERVWDIVPQKSAHYIPPEDRGELIPGFTGQSIIFECDPNF